MFVVGDDKLLRIVKRYLGTMAQSVVILGHFREILDQLFCRGGLPPLAHVDLNLHLHRFSDFVFDLGPTSRISINNQMDWDSEGDTHRIFLLTCSLTSFFISFLRVSICFF